MERADKDGLYEIETADGETTRIFIAKGDAIPDGATFSVEFTPNTAEEPAADEQKAKGAAPQNKAR